MQITKAALIESLVSIDPKHFKGKKRAMNQLHARDLMELFASAAIKRGLVAVSKDITRDRLSREDVTLLRTLKGAS